MRRARFRRRQHAALLASPRPDVDPLFRGRDQVIIVAACCFFDEGGALDFVDAAATHRSRHRTHYWLPSGQPDFDVRILDLHFCLSQVAKRANSFGWCRGKGPHLRGRAITFMQRGYAKFYSRSHGAVVRVYETRLKNFLY